MFKLDAIIASFLVRYKDTKLFAIMAVVLIGLSAMVEVGLANNWITEDSFGGTISRAIQVFTFLKLVFSQMDVAGAKGPTMQYPILLNLLWIIPIVGTILLCRYFYNLLIVCGDCGAKPVDIALFITSVVVTFLAMILVSWKLKSLLD